MTNHNLSFAEAELFNKIAEPFINRIAIRTAEIIQSNQTAYSEQTEDDDLIVSKEACRLLKCTPVTLWRWEKKGRVKSYGICGKKYFKRSELLESLTQKK